MKTVGKISVLLLFTLLLGGCSTSRQEVQANNVDKNGVVVRTETMKPLNDGKQAINFKLNDLNGKVHSLDDYRGKKVYIEYWASWCPVCLDGIGEFPKLVRNFEKSPNVVVLSIVSPGAFGEKTSAEFARWFGERGYDFPVLLDEGGQVARQFGVRAFPTSIYIGSDGVLVASTPGQYPNESILAKIAAMK